MKILVDMNLSPKWVDFLIENGIEAAHWSTIGSSNSPDTDIFAYAKKHDFTIFTNDCKFTR
jgi:predicted nuclease of predicted toxin-antitoxin system